MAFRVFPHAAPREWYDPDDGSPEGDKMRTNRTLLLIALAAWTLALPACGDDEFDDGSDADADSDSDTDSDSDADSDTDSDTDTDSDADAGTDTEEMTPVIELPGLVSITFWERTGGDAPTSYEFAVDGPELSAMLPDPLTIDNSDIVGVPNSEFYDVYYSDAEGGFDLLGPYLTISGVYGAQAPAGPGLNLAEIGLNFEDSYTEYGNYVASWVFLGDNAYGEDTVTYCIDGDLQTHTGMGNTVGSDERLRLTLGFESTSGPIE
jgi:hypothetical protein